MKLKKLLAGLAVTGVALGLASCSLSDIAGGSTTDSASGTSNNTNSSSETTKEALEGVSYDGKIEFVNESDGVTAATIEHKVLTHVTAPEGATLTYSTIYNKAHGAGTIYDLDVTATLGNKATTITVQYGVYGNRGNCEIYSYYKSNGKLHATKKADMTYDIEFYINNNYKDYIKQNEIRGIDFSKSLENDILQADKIVVETDDPNGWPADLLLKETANFSLTDFGMGKNIDPLEIKYSDGYAMGYAAMGYGDGSK